MNEEAASSTARSMSAVEMPSKTLRTVSRAISSTSISPPLPDWSKPCVHSWIACCISEMSNSTELAVALDHGELAEQRALGHLFLALLARLLVLGPVQDVALGDLVQSVLDQVLLDDVLDVLDVGIQFDEAVVDLGGDAREQVVQLAVAEHGGDVWLSGRAHRLADGGGDPLPVEAYDFAGAP